MSKDTSGTVLNRRGFLRGLATAGGAAAATGLLTETANATMPAESAEDIEPPSSRGYRLTPHILEYYEKARF